MRICHIRRRTCGWAMTLPVECRFLEAAAAFHMLIVRPRHPAEVIFLFVIVESNFPFWISNFLEKYFLFKKIFIIHFVASRLRLHRNSLRRVAASISSERTGHWLRRQANDALRHVRDPHLWLPLFKKYYRKWHLKHLLPLFFVMVYMLVGAIIFFSLESAPENKRLARR